MNLNKFKTTKALKKDKTFEFKSFSKKQLKVLTWWKHTKYKDKAGIICEGSVRSGKTVSMILSFVLWANSNFENSVFIVAGKTVGSLKRNVISELIKMLNSLDIEYSINNTNNYIEIGNNNNIFYMFGGGNEASQDLIQGLSASGAFFDEVALMKESFVNQAISRCNVSSSKSNTKLWFNCNPSTPSHFFKKNFIDKAKEKNFYHLHFTMIDNLSLTKEYIERMEKMYTGVFYDRYIKGLWTAGEGCVYSNFDKKRHVKDLVIKDTTKFVVAVDYGTQNPCTFNLFEYRDNGTLYLCKSYYHDGRNSQKQKSDSEYAEDLVKFIKDYRNRVQFILVDPSASSFIIELNKSKYRLPRIVKAKNDVIDGIRVVSNYLNEDKLIVNSKCKEVIEEFESYSWDTKASELQGKDIVKKENDHAMDSIRYCCYYIYLAKNKNKARIKAKPKFL